MNVVGILLNSFSSVLSYNNLYYKLILEKLHDSKDEQQETWHQTTFIKQLAYYMIIFFLLLLLSISTFYNIPDGMVLIDLNGFPQKMTTLNVLCIVAAGWLSFLVSISLNVLYYKLHPMAVEMNLSDKLKTHLFGEPIPKSSTYVQDFSDSKLLKSDTRKNNKPIDRKHFVTMI